MPRVVSNKANLVNTYSRETNTHNVFVAQDGVSSAKIQREIEHLVLGDVVGKPNRASLRSTKNLLNIAYEYSVEQDHARLQQ